MAKITIDIDRLAHDLVNYYGTGMVMTGSPFAMMSVERVRHASDEELIAMADECGIDIMKYRI